MKRSITKFTILLSLPVLLSGKLSYSQHQVSTFAGSSQGFQDGGALTSKFAAPTDVCISPDGAYIYVADYSGNRIRKINKSTNQVSTVAGSGTAGSVNGIGTSASFSFPTGLAISADGNFLFVADNGNSLIRKIDLSNNAVTTIAGDGDFDHSDNTNGLLAKFNQPSDLALWGDSVLFITDTENHVIRKMNLQTTAVSTVVGYVGVGGFLDGVGTGAAVKNPAGIAISTDGTRLYLADNGNNMVRKIDLPSYNVSVIAGTGTPGFGDNTNGLQAVFYAPQGVAVDPVLNILYVTDTYNHRIRMMDVATSAVTTIAGDGSVPPASTFANNTNGLLAKFFYPSNCVVSPDGQSIYVADQGNFKIREVKTDNASNTPPQAGNDLTSTSANTSVSIDITANDSDADGSVDVLTIDLDPNTAGIQTSFTSAQGTFTVNTSGVVTYTPAAGFTGTAILYYTINDNNGATSNVATLTVTVTALNISPSATNDVTSTTTNTAVTINIISNDSDVDGSIDLLTIDLDPSTAGIQTTFTTTGGTFTVDASGTVMFTPAAGFTGTAILYYTVNDNSGATSNVATLTVTVSSVNINPTANDDNASTNINTTVSVNVIDNDSDADGTVDLLSIDLDPNTGGVQTTFTTTGGTFTVDATGLVTFTPVAGFTGSVQLFYTISDNNGAVSNVATLTVTVLSGTSGIEDLTNNGFTVFPNPATSFLTLKAKETQELNVDQIRIVSVAGTESIVPVILVEDGLIIDVSSLSTGCYYLHWTSKSEQVNYYKFFKN